MGFLISFAAVSWFFVTWYMFDKMMGAENNRVAWRIAFVTVLSLGPGAMIQLNMHEQYYRCEQVMK